MNIYINKKKDAVEISIDDKAIEIKDAVLSDDFDIRELDTFEITAETIKLTERELDRPAKYWLIKHDKGYLYMRGLEILGRPEKYDSEFPEGEEFSYAEFLIDEWIL